jgi:hypothetical protein
VAGGQRVGYIRVSSAGQNPGRQLDGIGLDRAHLLLQIRTRVLNDQLADDLRRWYPGFNQAPDPMTLTA